MLINFYIFLLISCTGLIVGYIRNTKIISPYNIFIIYNLFYISTIVYVSINNENKLYLSNNEEVIVNLINSIIFGISSFIITYLLNITQNPLSKYQYYKVNKFLYLLYIINFISLLYFAEKYGWHQVSRAGIQDIFTTIFAYLKYSFIVISIFFIWNFSKSKKFILLILILNIVVAFLDGGRTTLFGLIIAYMWFQFNSKSFKVLLIFLLFILLILFIRSYELNPSELLQGISDSIEAEGIYGSYNALQFFDFFSKNPEYKIYGLSYLIDPLIYLLPSDFRNDMLFLQNSISSYSGVEPLNIMGGFYWVAESIANFGIYGSVLVGVFYGYIVAKSESFNGFKSIYTLLIIASMTCLLAKASFANLFKISSFYIIFFVALKIIFLKK